jgi:hypothetical protein
MENNNNNNKMNIVTKTLTTLPEEVCNIIYEYYKLPFDVKRHKYWENLEEHFGRELTELAVAYRMNKFKDVWYDNLIAYTDSNYNVIVAGNVIYDHRLPIKSRIIFAKNILIYGSDLHRVPADEELDRICHSNPKHLSENYDHFLIKKIKDHARQNGIRVQKNSKMETLIKRLMKV